MTRKQGFSLQKNREKGLNFFVCSLKYDRTVIRRWKVHVGWPRLNYLMLIQHLLLNDCHVTSNTTKSEWIYRGKSKYCRFSSLSWDGANHRQQVGKIDVQTCLLLGHWRRLRMFSVMNHESEANAWNDLV